MNWANKSHIIRSILGATCSKTAYVHFTLSKERHWEACKIHSFHRIDFWHTIVISNPNIYTQLSLVFLMRRRRFIFTNHLNEIKLLGWRPTALELTGTELAGQMVNGKFASTYLPWAVGWHLKYLNLFFNFSFRVLADARNIRYLNLPFFALLKINWNTWNFDTFHYVVTEKAHRVPYWPHCSDRYGF